MCREGEFVSDGCFCLGRVLLSWEGGMVACLTESAGGFGRNRPPPTILPSRFEDGLRRQEWHTKAYSPSGGENTLPRQELPPATNFRVAGEGGSKSVFSVFS